MNSGVVKQYQEGEEVDALSGESEPGACTTLPVGLGARDITLIPIGVDITSEWKCGVN